MDPCSIRTPCYDHLNAEDFNHIYSPSEDSFLLIDAFEKDIDDIKQQKPSLCVEIGVGSGIVITALASVLGQSCRYIGTDINTIACAKAQETGRLNGVHLETYCGDLDSGIPEDVKGAIDILIFNPPYVVTESDEVAAGHLQFTWAGGKRGREVMDRLFPHISSLLSPEGVFYLVLEKKNQPEEVASVLRQFGFSHECVLERKSLFESLLVMKFKRNKSALTGREV
ncbi:UNVERIFIED_CONTAM: hypothetical protein GTU68_022445 [Idotea baltica]|nr:hypothetical protein [Idotea baltica]